MNNIGPPCRIFLSLITGFFSFAVVGCTDSPPVPPTVSGAALIAEIEEYKRKVEPKELFPPAVQDGFWNEVNSAYLGTYKNTISGYLFFHWEEEGVLNRSGIESGQGWVFLKPGGVAVVVYQNFGYRFGEQTVLAASIFKYPDRYVTASWNHEASWTLKGDTLVVKLERRNPARHIFQGPDNIVELDVLKWKVKRDKELEQEKAKRDRELEQEKVEREKDESDLRTKILSEGISIAKRKADADESAIKEKDIASGKQEAEAIAAKERVAAEWAANFRAAAEKSAMAREAKGRDDELVALREAEARAAEVAIEAAEVAAAKASEARAVEAKALQARLAPIPNLYEVDKVDNKPVHRRQPRPAYPFDMRRAGISGEVVVGLVVTTEGSVTESWVVRSTRAEFEEPALKAVQNWLFKPASKGGRPVNVRMEVPVVFSLNED